MELDQHYRKENVKKIINKFIELGFKNKDILEKEPSLIESGVYKYSLDHVSTNNIPFLIESIYDEKINEIISLLNKEIIDNIINKKIASKELINLDNNKISGNVGKILNKKKKSDDLLKKKGTNAYKCPKCGESNAEVVELQMRAADEPATVFINCLECGHTESE